jgi:transketolase
MALEAVTRGGLIMRNQFASTFFDCAQKDDKLCLIVADISPAGSIQKFRETYPDRFINTGVAEQIMIGMAAGMALKGMKPFCYTIATFALYRPFEFIRDDLAYQDLPVTIVGIGGGQTYSTLGATHHAMEDIAVASSIPNLQVLAPCDPYEVAEATLYCANRTKGGPIYLRLGKAGEPDLGGDPDWEFGKIRMLRKAQHPFRPHSPRGLLQSKCCILTYGSIAKRAIDVAELIEKKANYSPAVYSVSTLVPLDEGVIASFLRQYKSVVVIEEHVVSTGLGRQVGFIRGMENLNYGRLENFGLSDKFRHFYGSHDEILADQELSVEHIAQEIMSRD